VKLMTWFLQQQDKDGSRDAASFLEDHPVVIGRSSTADVPVPRDDMMSSQHASLKIIEGECQFTDLGSTNGTFLNEERVAEGILKPTDQLRCGATVFRVESSERPLVSEQPGATPVPNSSPTTPADASETVPVSPGLKQCTGFVAESAADVIAQFDLGEVLSESPDNGETATDFAGRLLSSEEPTDSFKFLAAALPKRLSVWWAVQCIRSEEGLATEADTEVLHVVSEWVAAPNDEIRRQSMQLAEDIGMKTPAAWAAVAAFWSDGSMSPADQPEVPAPGNMAAQAVAGAVTLASVVQSPERAPERRKAFVALAHQISSGELSWKSE
jgi:pSer/pThr/pTyr-binding forkhead associated (FHA) protein